MSPLPIPLARERERELLAMLEAEDLSINISWPSAQRQAGMNGTLNDDEFIVCRQTGQDDRAESATGELDSAHTHTQETTAELDRTCQ